MTGWIIAACLVVFVVAHQWRGWREQAARVAADRDGPAAGSVAAGTCPVHGRVEAPVTTVVVDPAARVAWFPCGGCGEAVELQMSDDPTGAASVHMFVECGALTVGRVDEWAAETQRLVGVDDFLDRAEHDDDLEPWDSAW